MGGFNRRCYLIDGFNRRRCYLIGGFNRRCYLIGGFNRKKCYLIGGLIEAGVIQ